MEMYFRVFRLLVRVVDPGKVPDLPCPGFPVQALGVALLRHIQGTIHVDFDKIEARILVQFPHPVPVLTVRADKGGQDQQARIHEQFGYLADAADILRPVLRGETQVPVDSHTDDEFYQLLSYKDDRDLHSKLAEWEQFYNFSRPHGAHLGKTPYEAMREKLL